MGADLCVELDFHRECHKEGDVGDWEGKREENVVHRMVVVCKLLKQQRIGLFSIVQNLVGIILLVVLERIEKPNEVFGAVDEWLCGEEEDEGVHNYARNPIVTTFANCKFA